MAEEKFNTMTGVSVFRTLTDQSINLRETLPEMLQVDLSLDRTTLPGHLRMPITESFRDGRKILAAVELAQLLGTEAESFEHVTDQIGDLGPDRKGDSVRYTRAVCRNRQVLEVLSHPSDPQKMICFVTPLGMDTPKDREQVGIMVLNDTGPESPSKVQG